MWSRLFGGMVVVDVATLALEGRMKHTRYATARAIAFSSPEVYTATTPLKAPRA